MIKRQRLLLIINNNYKGVINMNNFKKIGLTALAGSLIATSAFAVESTITGSSSIDVKNHEKTQAGKNWSMGNSVTLGFSGETDGGLSISTSFELDQGAADGSAGVFDSHSITVSSDSLGTLVFAGHGGDSAQGAIDTTAAGNIWDNTFSGAAGAFSAPAAARAGNDSMLYTLPSVVDDLKIMASYAPGNSTAESQTSWAASYTGVEGLTVDFGVGDSGVRGSEVESTTYKGTYAIGSFTLGYSNTDNDKTGASNREVTSYGVSYTVSDNLSVSYGQETFDTTGASVDEEVESISVSYTTGGMTLTASSLEATGINNSSSDANKQGLWTLAASFAF
jgi:outer membrane protein OmpU